MEESDPGSPLSQLSTLTELSLIREASWSLAVLCPWVGLPDCSTGNFRACSHYWQHECFEGKELKHWGTLTYQRWSDSLGQCNQEGDGKLQIQTWTDLEVFYLLIFSGVWTFIQNWYPVYQEAMSLPVCFYILGPSLWLHREAWANKEPRIAESSSPYSVLLARFQDI